MILFQTVLFLSCSNNIGNGFPMKGKFKITFRFDVNT
jgi:hypothetical protein